MEKHIQSTDVTLFTFIPDKPDQSFSGEVVRVEGLWGRQPTNTVHQALREHVAPSNKEGDPLLRLLQLAGACV